MQEELDTYINELKIEKECYLTRYLELRDKIDNVVILLNTIRESTKYTNLNEYEKAIMNECMKILNNNGVNKYDKNSRNNNSDFNSNSNDFLQC